MFDCDMDDIEEWIRRHNRKIVEKRTGVRACVDV